MSPGQIGGRGQAPPLQRRVSRGTRYNLQPGRGGPRGRPPKPGGGTQMTRAGTSPRPYVSAFDERGRPPAMRPGGADAPGRPLLPLWGNSPSAHIGPPCARLVHLPCYPF